MVLFIALVLSVLLAVVFGVDTSFLFIPFVSHHEFTHPFGALAAFISQAIVGLFIFNMTFNGAALITFMVLSALVVAHAFTIRRTI